MVIAIISSWRHQQLIIPQLMDFAELCLLHYVLSTAANAAVFTLQSKQTVSIFILDTDMKSGFKCLKESYSLAQFHPVSFSFFFFTFCLQGYWDNLEAHLLLSKSPLFVASCSKGCSAVSSLVTKAAMHFKLAGNASKTPGILAAPLV